LQVFRGRFFAPLALLAKVADRGGCVAMRVGPVSADERGDTVAATENSTQTPSGFRMKVDLENATGARKGPSDVCVCRSAIGCRRGLGGSLRRQGRMEGLWLDGPLRDGYIGNVSCFSFLLPLSCNAGIQAIFVGFSPRL
jgi:hypothetical protein